MISTSSEPYVLEPMAAMSMSGMEASLYDVNVLEVSNIVLVMASGAGPPLARLYLMPKSFLGPTMRGKSCVSSPEPGEWQDGEVAYRPGCGSPSTECHP